MTLRAVDKPENERSERQRGIAGMASAINRGNYNYELTDKRSAIFVPFEGCQSLTVRRMVTVG